MQTPSVYQLKSSRHRRRFAELAIEIDISQTRRNRDCVSVDAASGGCAYGPLEFWKWLLGCNSRERMPAMCCEGYAVNMKQTRLCENEMQVPIYTSDLLML
jgi:hypothetical protein